MYNTNSELIIDSMIDNGGDVQAALDSIEYSTWIKDGDSYIPAVNTSTCNKIDSDVYRVNFADGSYRIDRIKLSTDEIYTFSNDTTKKIIDEIDLFWSKSDLYKKHNLVHKRGLLLMGPAGCGKTSLITLLIDRLKANDGIIFVVNNYKDFSVLNECLSPVIRKIEPERPIITIIEDVDKLIEENNENDAELLNFLDGKNSINHHIVIMTSNNTSHLSEAMLRPSRTDMHFVINKPNKDIRREYFAKKGIPKSELDGYVDNSNDMSFAEMKELFVGANILGKPFETVVKSIKTPRNNRDYLTNKKIGY